MTTAEHPAGPWSPLHPLSDETGWDDPCPLWDEDGRAWLVASSPGRGAWITWLIPMSPDGRSIDLDGRAVIDDWHTSEGNKIYKLGGRYYVLHNEVRGDGNRVLVIMRAASASRRPPGCAVHPHQTPARHGLDGRTFDPLGNTDTASWSDYRGARIALFSTAPTDDAGTARFDTFRYRFHQRLQTPTAPRSTREALARRWFVARGWAGMRHAGGHPG